MKLVWFSIIFTLVLVVFIPGILGVGIRKIPSGYQAPLTDSENLYGDLIVSQSFVAEKNNLSAIALTIKNFAFRNKKDLKFTITANGGESRTVSINGANIPDGAYQFFNFTPFANSQGKIFTLTFSSPDTTTADSYQLYRWANPAGVYKLNDEVKSGSLSFVSYYSTGNLFATWIMIYRNWFWKLFQDLPFAIFYGILIAGLAAYLVLNRKQFN